MPELKAWQHHHRFGTDVPGSGERRTRWVVGITLAMMVGEIVAGSIFGSMALLADGWHMGTHAAALGVVELIRLGGHQRREVYGVRHGEWQASEAAA